MLGSWEWVVVSNMVGSHTHIHTHTHTHIYDNVQPCPSSKVISIFDIDPTKIVIDRPDTESIFYMIRLKGTDTIL